MVKTNITLETFENIIVSLLKEKGYDTEIVTWNGTGFLYNMVRIIAGTLLEVGKGNVAPEQMEDIIKSADRKEAGPTAPAKGLKLVEIRYV